MDKKKRLYIILVGVFLTVAVVGAYLYTNGQRVMAWNGGVYEGHVSWLKPNGQGTFKATNGYQYVGSFKNGHSNLWVMF